MDHFDEKMVERMQEECDDGEHTCAACEAWGVDDPDEAEEPAIVRPHFGGWASPLACWVDLGETGWLVPMCSECAANAREQATEEE